MTMSEQQVLQAFDQIAQALQNTQESQRMALQQMEVRHAQNLQTVVEPNARLLEAKTKH